MSIKHVKLETPITRVRIRPGDGNTINVYFGDYRINLDTVKRCCEDYKLSINGKKDKPLSFAVDPTDHVTFTFTEETYSETPKSHMQKNDLLIKFGEGYRIRATRYNQYCSYYAHIYTRAVMLYNTKTEEERFLGDV